MSDENRTLPTPAKKSRRGASPERMREITRARMAKRRERTETSSVPPIEAFVTSPRYLGLTPSPYQLTVLKAMYGRPLDEQELKIWAECTRREYPEKAFSELTVVSGARSATNSYIELPIQLYEAILCRPVPTPAS